MHEADKDLDLGEPIEPRAARRESQDDFFCLRYEVWYASIDCAIRTKFRTSEGCLRCDQGRFNLKRHAPALRGFRFPFSLPD